MGKHAVQNNVKKAIKVFRSFGRAKRLNEKALMKGINYNAVIRGLAGLPAGVAPEGHTNLHTLILLVTRPSKRSGRYYAVFATGAFIITCMNADEAIDILLVLFNHMHVCR